MTSSPLRLGLIGAGRWGRVLLRTIQATPDVRLAWVASHAPGTRALVEPDVRVVEDWRTLPDAGVDGVVIASPAPLHGTMLRLAIECGVPAFVEKPLTMNLVEARALAALAEARDALVLVDHTHLFQPGYEVLRRMVAADGGPRAVLSEGGQWGRYGGDVGALWDYGPHDVALCLDLVGLDARVEAAERVEARALPEGPGENLRLSLRWASGVTARIEVGNLMVEKRRRFAVTCASATYLLDDLAEHPLRRFPALSPVRWPVAADGGEPIATARELPLDRAVRRFADGIRGVRDGHPAFGTGLAVEVVRILAEAQEVIGQHPNR